VPWRIYQGKSPWRVVVLLEFCQQWICEMSRSLK
jgi:hypothetical protein